MLVQCIPDTVIRTKVMALAEREGIPAMDSGCCIRYATPENASELSRVLDVIHHGKRMSLGQPAEG